MESLYRKYRPKTFDDVVGQKHVVATLRRAVLEGRVSHAYLFCGPRGTGKTTMARLLAKALLCGQGAGKLPDGTCEDCELIAAGEHPDVYELDAASNTGVENVREEIINRVSYAPVRGDYKVYIIDEVHMLTPAAFNALLKTLEEPPEHIVFIMCTTDPQKVLETILSRVQRFDFRPISNDELLGRLEYVCEQEGFTYEREALDLVVLHARGGMRDALSSLERLATYCGGSITLEAAQEMLGEVPASTLAEVGHALASRDIPRLFTEVASLTDTGRDLLQFTRELTAHLRDVYVVSAVGERPGVVAAQGDALARLGEEARAFGSVDRIARAMAVLGDASSEMRTAPNQRLILELAFTRIARPESEITMDALAERVAVLEGQLAQVMAGGVAVAAPVAAAAPSQPVTAPVPAPVPAPEPEPVPASEPESVRQAPAPEPAPTPAPAPAPEPEPAPAPMPAPAPAPAPAPQPVVDAGAAITDPGELQRRWRQVCDELRANSPSRGTLLMNSNIVSDDGQTLTVTLPKGSTFAAKMLERADVRESMAPVVARAFGRRQVIYTEGAAGAVSAPAPAPAPTPAPKPAPAPTPTPAPAPASAPAPEPAPAPQDDAGYDLPWNEPPREEVPYTDADAASYVEDDQYAPEPPAPEPVPDPEPVPAPEPAPEPEPTPAPVPEPEQQPAADSQASVPPRADESHESQVMAMLTDVFGPGVTMSKVSDEADNNND